MANDRQKRRAQNTQIKRTLEHFKRLRWRTKRKQFGLKELVLFSFYEWIDDLIERLMVILVGIFVIYFLVEFMTGATLNNEFLDNEWNKAILLLSGAGVGLFLIIKILKNVIKDKKRVISMDDCNNCSTTGIKTNGICRECNGIGLLNRFHYK